MNESRMTHKKNLREQAEIRQKEYDALSVEQKIARAVTRRGNSKKELERLHAIAN